MRQSSGIAIVTGRGQAQTRDWAHHLRAGLPGSPSEGKGLACNSAIERRPRMTSARLAGLAYVIAMAVPPEHRPGWTTWPRATPLASSRPSQHSMGAMPTGVMVHRGESSVNFPKWGGKVDFTAAEVKQGKAVAYSDASVDAEHLISVQSVVVDPRDRLYPQLEVIKRRLLCSKLRGIPSLGLENQAFLTGFGFACRM